MIYNRSPKASDIRFRSRSWMRKARSAPTSFNLYEGTYMEIPSGTCRRSPAGGAWKSFSAGLKAYNNTYARDVRHWRSRRTW